ncbi:DUF2087 domain-containing protein [Nocardioides sp. zg-1228]|uniref:DUF2087 domain-containing protein n=1 Tax=Nocardioides sp. zg-1228 TaxID=2763008 RepID=UPI0016423F0C|nr:DUF2087 domain-containing protein [Nocardioides sp. zg-1228]MBC2932234.1 DUF2087 domain-containing protein [Nocardioides sp. zg-1228]QSF57762.1 DUF2087 domain-containing protein [Nocardioides sp. zg-1228]
MTRDSDFKRVVRARMAETGEGYAAARAALEQEAYDAALAEQRRVVDRFVRDGRLARVPAKRTVRAAVLLEVLSRFEPGRDYSEPEVNDVLRGVHEDVAYLRRELVNYHYLQRADGRYRTAAQAPIRSVVERQEIPDWEAHWLPGFLAGAFPRAQRTGRLGP